jgi:AraC-like DNA-binding protein
MQSAVAQSEASKKKPWIAEFGDPQAYQAAISPARVEILVTAKGKFRTTLTEIELHRLRLQRGRESLPRIANAALSADRLALFFLTGKDQASTRHNGRVLEFGEIATSTAGSTNHHRTDGSCHWATLAITRDDLAAAAHTLVGRDLIEGAVTRYFRPTLPAMSRLLKLHKNAGELAEGASDTLAQPEPSRALEKALLHTLTVCLRDTTPVQMSSGTVRHSAIIARFEEILTANYDQPLYLEEICVATGVSERTLRLSCMEHMGMGPVRYLWLRRMHLARRALLSAAPGTKTVTEIATGSGFWELGRFAIEYRALFGEVPSATLGRPAEEVRQLRNNPFVLSDSEYDKGCNSDH